MRYERIIMKHIPTDENISREDLLKNTRLKNPYKFDIAISNLIKDGFIKTDIQCCIYLEKSYEHFKEYYIQWLQGKIIPIVTLVTTIISAVAGIISLLK